MIEDAGNILQWLCLTCLEEGKGEDRICNKALVIKPANWSIKYRCISVYIEYNDCMLVCELELQCILDICSLDNLPNN